MDFNYGNPFPNKEEEHSKKKAKKKSGFGKGIAAGIGIGMLSVTMVLAIVFLLCLRAGYVHVGVNGEIYVQDAPVTDDEGIGSDVEKKLNALEGALDEFYFDKVDNEAAKDAIYKAYLASYGDKYTIYYTADEYKSVQQSTTGKFYGVGAVCQKNEDGTILITDAYKEAPAYNAGIRNGDCVVKVDGEDIRELELQVAVSKIKGPKGTQVTLEILRKGQIMTFTITRDEINIRTVSYEMLEDKIGYIYVSQFGENTSVQFKKAIDDLNSQGMIGLVIDVRANPGGLLTAVVDMLDYILPKGLIVYTEDKSGKRREYNGTDGNELNIPYVVLVNGSSASASEIFAGAIQDYGKGIILGTQTFGKGIVQSIRPLTDGSAIKYTTAKYFTPKGQDIHKKGVTPDKVVELPDDATDDLQLNAAVEYIKNGK